MDLLNQAGLLLEYDQQIKDMEQELKGMKERRDEINAGLAELMADNETQNLNYKGHIFYLSVWRSVSYDKEQEESFYHALRENGLADIIRPTVNSRTLTATVTKELMQEDEDGNSNLPEWIQPFITIYEKTKVNVRKG